MISYLRRAFGSIGSILEVLWPSHDYWYWPTDVEPSDQGGPGLLDKQRSYTAEQVREASDVVEWLSGRYHYVDVAHVGWSADEMRDAAEVMDV